MYYLYVYMRIHIQSCTLLNGSDSADKSHCGDDGSDNKVSDVTHVCFLVRREVEEDVEKLELHAGSLQNQLLQRRHAQEDPVLATAMFDTMDEVLDNNFYIFALMLFFLIVFFCSVNLIHTSSWQ